MALNTANMDDCTPKCVAPYGPNEGTAYPCDEPCSNTQIFDSDYFDCIDPSSFNYARWTGTIFSGFSNVTTEYTSPWRTMSAGSFLTIGPAFQASIIGCRPIEEDNFAGYWSLPPIGPIPWRATVRAVDYSTGFGGYGKVMGGLGFNSNNNPCSFIDPYIRPSVGMPSTTDTGVVYIITGKWQFSDDRSTIELEWNGDTDSSGPEIP